MTLTDRMSWCAFFLFLSGETDDLLDLTPMTFFWLFLERVVVVAVRRNITVMHKMSDKEFPMCF